VFRRLGDLCLAARTKLALEPAAPSYRTNALNTTAETIAFARRVAHPCVSVNFDIGTLQMVGEVADGSTLFKDASGLVSHIHVSEPNLAQAPADIHALEKLARSIIHAGYCGWFSVEMRQVGEDNVAAVGASLIRTAAALSAAERVEA
jgi:sugar phosphate isomerase/epimerase